MELIEENAETFLYAYSGYNQSQENWKDDFEKKDGRIMICRNAIFNKNVFISDLLNSQKIIVINSSGAWKTSDGIDVIAKLLLSKFFKEMLDTGKVPKRISWDS